MKNHHIIMLCVFFFAILSTAEEKVLPTYTIKNITFQTPVELSDPINIGLEAFGMSYPKDAKLGEETFEIRLIFITKEMLTNMPMDNDELLQYVKSVFLGTTKKAEKYNRDFLGKTITGEIISKKIPKPLGMEVYLLTLKNESKLAIAFLYDKAMDSKNVEGIISTIASTLQEKE